MSKAGRGVLGTKSIRYLLDHVPDDGCMLIFNCYHRNVRSKAMGILHVWKISDDPIPRATADSKETLCDVYVTFRDAT